MAGLMFGDKMLEPECLRGRDFVDDLGCLDMSFSVSFLLAEKTMMDYRLSSKKSLSFLRRGTDLRELHHVVPGDVVLRQSLSFFCGQRLKHALRLVRADDEQLSQAQHFPQLVDMET